MPKIQNLVNHHVLVDEVNRAIIETSPVEVLLSFEPPAGSTVVAYGISGTAYQRHFEDGRWHGTNGHSIGWKQLVEHAKGNIIVLTWIAPEPKREVA